MELLKKDNEKLKNIIKHFGCPHTDDFGWCLDCQIEQADADVLKAMNRLAELQKIVEVKVRHGVVCAMIRSGQITIDEAPIHEAKLKKCVNRWVEFIVTGE